MSGPILIVDDDAQIRETIAEILESDGYQTVEATHGAQGLTHLHAGLEPCAIVLDLMMPVMDGHEMFEKLPERLQRRAIIITAGHDAAPKGAFALLRKPFDLKALLRSLQELCPSPTPSPVTGS